MSSALQPNRAAHLRRLIPLVLLVGVLLPGSLAAGTMTFAPPFTSGYVECVEDGLRLTSNAAMYLAQNSGTRAMFPSTKWQTMTLTMADNSPFTLVSMDIAEAGTYPPVPETIVFVGTLEGGGTVTHTVVTDGICCLDATVGYQTMVFPAGFTGLLSVSWDHSDPDAGASYDNLVAVQAPVPVEPATWGRVKSLYGAR